MAELNNISQRPSRRATKSKTQATKSRIYASSLCKIFIRPNALMLGKPFMDIARLGDDRPVTHKRREQPALG